MILFSKLVRANRLDLAKKTSGGVEAGNTSRRSVLATAVGGLAAYTASFVVTKRSWANECTYGQCSETIPSEHGYLKLGECQIFEFDFDIMGRYECPNDGICCTGAPTGGPFGSNCWMPANYCEGP